MPDNGRFTLMTVHAHPDDETISTGGVMAKAVADGHRVVLITGTRGEMGEIVVPEMDTPDNHRRLGEIRAEELEAAMGALGVTEWDNLGYRDSDMMGRVGNTDPRCFWRADLDEAVGRLVWMIRRHKPDVVTTYNDFGGYGHPDHIRVHQVTVPAFDRAGDPAWYPEQLTPAAGGTGPSADEGGLEPWAPRKLYETAFSISFRGEVAKRLEELGEDSPFAPPKDASPEQLAEHQERIDRMQRDEERITTRVDITPFLDRKWDALHKHVTQMAPDVFFLRFGIEMWREGWHDEAFVLTKSRDVETSLPEADLFAGL
jgi:LmbE family N-acetylglucosaminyl deacetylase